MKLKLKINEDGPKVWFMSDPHFGYKNIVIGETTWDTDKIRQFQTTKEHDDHIISLINDKVKDDDIIFCLGDFTHKGDLDPNNVISYRSRIKCKNIHFIFGNHDDLIIENETLQEEFTSCGYYIDLKIETPVTTHHILMSHYAMRSWDALYNGSIMLFGHSHNMLDTYIHQSGVEVKTMDVGIDTREDYGIYSLDEILRLMETKSIPALEKKSAKKRPKFKGFDNRKLYG